MKICILIVDDEPDVAELFKRKFRREMREGSFAMHFAESGEEAIEMLAGGVEPQIMLILSDINMPGMSGMELLSEVKMRWPGLPVAMITAYGDPESERRAYAAGASDFLSKPIDFDSLKSKIASLVRAAEG